MTYLEAVNAVLRRIREDEVTAVNSSTYSKMVGDFVNDAYTRVVSAWDWTSLRQEIVITTSDGVSEYPLTGTSQSSSIMFAFNETNKYTMQYYPLSVIKQYYLDDPSRSAPYAYTTLNTTDGVPVLKLYPEPNDVYVLEFTTEVRNPLLTGNDDELLVPHMPVVHLAVALLARERGETGGTSTQEYFAMAKEYLNDAIAYDANMSPEKITWNYI